MELKTCNSFILHVFSVLTAVLKLFMRPYCAEPVPVILNIPRENQKKWWTIFFFFKLIMLNVYFKYNIAILSHFERAIIRSSVLGCVQLTHLSVVSRLKA